MIRDSNPEQLHSSGHVPYSNDDAYYRYCVLELGKVSKRSIIKRSIIYRLTGGVADACSRLIKICARGKRS